MSNPINDSDSCSGSLDNSDGEERIEIDSDYETDNGGEIEDGRRDRNINVMWTGYSKKLPVILFSVRSIFNEHLNLKTVGEQYHLAFKFGTSECKIICRILVTHGFHEVHQNSQDFNLAWTNCHLKPFTLRTLTEFQKINHFPRSYELTRKDRLYKNIQRMQQIKGVKNFDCVPQSFVLPGEYQEFCSQFLKSRGPWIVKPVASSRGRGVFLVNHPDQIPIDLNLIVSQYISNPLVIDGFKFDVRLYVAVTSYDPLIIYLYEEGLTRFATVKYERSSKHLRNQCMHLTNYSVNKKNYDYVRNDDPDIEDYGNKWSLGAMLRYLRSMGKDTAELMMRIEDMVIKTLLSVELSIATACKMFMPYRGNCFELYGFDILIDDIFKPWVLEVNLSPSLACDSPLDLKIKGHMLCDLFGLCGIICHDPMTRTFHPQSRKSQAITAKLSGRAKTAFSRPAITKPKSRPQSASTSESNVAGGNIGAAKSSMSGLNSEEIKIVRRVKEEEQRRGGWIRIFPGPDTWDVYGCFLQFNTSHNLMLHQRLFPERHNVTSTKSSSACLSSASRSRVGYMQVTGSASSKLDSEKPACSYALAMSRTKQYESMLGSKSKRRNKCRRKGLKSRASKRLTEHGNYEGQNQSDDDAEDDQGRIDCVDDSNTTTEVGKLSDVVSQVNVREVKVQEVVRPPSPPPPITPHRQQRMNVVDMLMRGKELSKSQARSAFALYLVRVRHRLMSGVDNMHKEDIEVINGQMDLVLRFLRRAATNMPQSFSITMSSQNLPFDHKRRILAKQLGRFVDIYNRETEQLKQQDKLSQDSLSFCNKANEVRDEIDCHMFESFVSSASENELEAVLTTYTKINRSASIFLGSGFDMPSDQTHDLSSDYLTSAQHLCHKHDNFDGNNMKALTDGGKKIDILNSGRSLSQNSVIHSNAFQSTASASNVSQFNMLQNYVSHSSMTQPYFLQPNVSNFLFSQAGASPPCVSQANSSQTCVSQADASKNYASQPNISPSCESQSNASITVASQANTTQICVHQPFASQSTELRFNVSHSSSMKSNYSQSCVAQCDETQSNVSAYVNLASSHVKTSTRPHSASALKYCSRPFSASGSKPCPFTTSEPIIDTYNEQAICEALYRLAARQKARQYSATNGCSSLNGSDSCPVSSHGKIYDLRPCTSVSCCDTPVKQAADSKLYSSVGSRSDSRAWNYDGAKCDGKPNKSASRSASAQHIIGKPPLFISPYLSNEKKLQSKMYFQSSRVSLAGCGDLKKSHLLSEKNDVHYQVSIVNASIHRLVSNNSNRWHLSSEHNNVYGHIGVSSQCGDHPKELTAVTARCRNSEIANTHMQHHVIMEQESRSLLDASKAKHHAMVAQAHAVQRQVERDNPCGSNNKLHGNELPTPRPSKLTNKPPTVPYRKPGCVQNRSRANALRPGENIDFNFYSSVQYDIHTGKLHQNVNSKPSDAATSMHLHTPNHKF